ncbi:MULTISPECIES: DUF502 domain-containing protein [unclassified Uliginosibacterium]|uniref:DUF502 domain-containing protein n=1 Tax=unclassified Uliginosibacterium TaxID=2621521 RepID=UPI000C7B4862|nr:MULTISPECIES: DUF502 domain-containing protein [unclassified Uliginosibacterium]MDO6385017.1 DUF502 domain-containing protein [Uliginosibacterium sp. 31-12]PLK48699.1 hypothetical protein C0V76_11625 [Uliginosibacterium sp. TH139]
MKKYLITGLLVWIPLVITVWVLRAIVSTLDQSLLLLPQAWQPNNLIGFKLWGLGTLITLLVVIATGVVASNFFGQRLVRTWESVLNRIPVVKQIYSSVKQVSDTLLGPGGQAFRKALLVQYPREGCWTIGFQTGTPGGELEQHLPAEVVSVYVPTTPNPTSGFFLMMARKDVVELEMSVDEALKFIISMGSVAPDAARN